MPGTNKRRPRARNPEDVITQTFPDLAEETEEIDVVAREFVLNKHVRKKYRCRCGACVETAPMPRRLVPGGRYSLAFAIAVAISKYADHLPLERQVKIMKREGLTVDSQTLYDQIEALARVLWPAYDRLGAELLDESVVFADETPWPLLGKDAESARWHAWTIACAKGAYYEIHDTRGLEAGKSLLAGFKGIAVTDGYGVYDALEKRMPTLRIAQCCAHCRRYYFKALDSDPERAKIALGFIGALFRIERTLADAPRKKKEKIRDKRSRPIVVAFFSWCDAEADKVLDDTPISNGIRYARNQRVGLSQFLEDGRLPIHNNMSELALRREAVGRNYAEVSIMRIALRLQRELPIGVLKGAA